MTQEYTPDTDDAIDLIAAGMGVVNQLGIAPVGYPRTEADAVESAKRWLAAHDAQIRAEAHVKALKLTDYEIEIMADAYSNSDEFNHGDDVGAMSVAVQAIIKHRREQQQ